MEINCNLSNVSYDTLGGSYLVVLSCNGELNVNDLKKLKDKPLNVRITQFKQKRSLNANAYAWKLMSEMAGKLRTSKEEVYEEMLRQYGTTLIDESGQAVIISILSNINIKKCDFHAMKAGVGFINGKEFTHYRIIKGSSEYDTKEMSIFIDGIVSECKELEIETLAPDEIERMKATWQQKA